MASETTAKIDEQLSRNQPYGEQLTFDTSAREVPRINANPVNYAPKKVFESPFLNANWNSGIVTITKGNRKKVLNFESENSPQRK